MELQHLRWAKPNRRTWLQTISAAAAIGATRCHEPWLVSAAAAAPTGQNLGLNLAPVRYWGSERPFNNLFLCSSPHVPLKQGGKWNDGGELDLDANGWITGYRPGQHSAFVLNLNEAHPNTAYDISFRGPHNAIRIQQSRDGKYVKRKDRDRLLVKVYSPIRDVRIQESGRATGELFAAPFVERCGQFRVLRFMDWLGTNEDREISWETRPTPEHYTQAGDEVALEHMVALCNQTQSAFWYCVHHRADDDYVRRVAGYVRAELEPGLQVYVEHSNEVWNGGFPQHRFCRQQAEKYMDYHVKRTSEVATIFREEDVEITGVLGLHAASTWAAEQALKNGVPDSIDATAIAPYFGGKIGRKPEIAERVMAGGMESVLDACHDSIVERTTEVRRHQELASRLGLKLLGYEGGQHLVAVGKLRRDPALTELLIAANRRPEMFELYTEYLDMWQTETDDSLMCLYYSVGIPSKSGSWGLLEYDGQPLRDAHKYRAVLRRLGIEATAS